MSKFRRANQDYAGYRLGMESALEQTHGLLSLARRLGHLKEQGAACGRKVATGLAASGLFEEPGSSGSVEAIANLRLRETEFLSDHGDRITIACLPGGNFPIGCLAPTVQLLNDSANLL